MARSTPALDKKLARRAVQLAMEFHRRELWQDFRDDEILAVVLPEAGETWFVSVMGAAGLERGLLCYSGAAGLRELRGILHGGSGQDGPLRCETMSISIGRPRDIPEPLRELHQVAGHNERLAPHIIIAPEGRAARAPRNSDLRRAIAILEAILLAEQRGLLRAAKLPATGPCRLPTIEARDKDVVVRFAEHEVEDGELRSGLIAPTDLGSVPRREVDWAIAFRPTPVTIGEDDRPIFLLLVLDVGAGRPALVQILPGEDLEGAAERVFALMQTGGDLSPPGRPRRIEFTNRGLHDAMAPALAEAGIATSWASDHPTLDESFDARLQMMLGGLSEEDFEDDEGVAAALDRVRDRLSQEIGRRGARSGRRDEEFFGADLDWLQESDIDADLAHDAWLAVDYRQSPRHRTIAERVLAGEIPDQERAILDGMLATPPSLYRLRRIEGECAVFEDLFSGAERRCGMDCLDVAELDLEEPEDGTLFGGRIWTVGEAGFAAPLTPLIPPALADRAIEHLVGCGLELSAEGVARVPQLLGRLFAWLANAAAKRPQLTNTDGDPLRLQNASFACADPAAAGAMLAGMDDFEFDDEDGAWIWFRPDRGERRTLLARVRPIADRLVVELNSDRRLERLRDRLETIPGVVFERSSPVEAADFHPSRSAPPTPIEASPGMLTAAQAMIHDHYMAWIDEAIPALGGQTPREAVRTPEGRRKVEDLMRSLDGPGGMPGLTVPLAEMRRRLGLGADGPPEQQASGESGEH
jgi:hypothetical protein